jgi:hypothetical protein
VLAVAQLREEWHLAQSQVLLAASVLLQDQHSLLLLLQQQILVLVHFVAAPVVPAVAVAALEQMPMVVLLLRLLRFAAVFAIGSAAPAPAQLYLLVASLAAASQLGWGSQQMTPCFAAAAAAARQDAVVHLDC